MSVLYGADRSTQEERVAHAKDVLQQRGFEDVRALMYPGGEVDRHTPELPREYHDFGFLAFIGARKGLSQSTLFEPAFLNRGFPQTLDSVEAALDQAAAYNGLFTVYFHGSARTT